jgi:hypothetical protein
MLLAVAVLLVAAEITIRLPAVRDALPPRRAYYDTDVSIRLDALDRVLQAHGRVDVLFAGSSIVRTSIRPLLFDRIIEAETGHPVVSFNGGMLAMWPAAVHLYLERVWLPVVQPRIIVQGIRYPELRADTHSLRDEQFFGGVLERGWHDASALARAVSGATERVRLLQYRGSLPAELLRWFAGRPGNPAGQRLSGTNARGYEARFPLLPDTRKRGLLQDTASHEDTCAQAGCAVGIAAIRRSHELASTRGAVYVLVNVPEFAARWVGSEGARRYADYLTTMQQLADEAGFLFIDVTGGDAAQFSDELEFSDYYHMSPHGAKRFTRELAAALAPLLTRPDILEKGAPDPRRRGASLSTTGSRLLSRRASPAPRSASGGS